jgi:hypothetical protein
LRFGGLLLGGFALSLTSLGGFAFYLTLLCGFLFCFTLLSGYAISLTLRFIALHSGLRREFLCLDIVAVPRRIAPEDFLPSR